MKKVLFVIERLCGGGAERALSNIVTHFPDDWHVDILVDDESLVEYPYKGNLLSLSCPEKDSTPHFIMSMIKRAIYLKKVKKSNGYSACISFMEGTSISNVLSGNRYCKTIVSIRNEIMPERAGTYSKVRDFLLTKLILTHADAVTAVSEEIASELIWKLKMPRHKVRAIVNGYDCEKIKAMMAQRPVNNAAGEAFMKEGRKIVVAVGRIVRQKGQWHLIRAFSEVVKEEPQAVLLIIGDGSLKGYLEELIRIYGLQQHVILTGRSDNPFWYLAAADVFVLPSLWEGYPNVLAEAVCCAAPCIAADVHSGPREILAPGLDAEGPRVKKISEQEYGILIPVCSGVKYGNHEPLEPEEYMMAETILRLLKDDAKRQYYIQKSRERRNDLDICTAVGKWLDVILDH